MAVSINRNGYRGTFKGVDVYRISPVRYICGKLYNDDSCIYEIEDQKILIRGNIVFAKLGAEGRVIELESNQQYQFYNPVIKKELKGEEVFVIDKKDIVVEVPEIVKETGIEIEPQLIVDDLLEGVYKWQVG